ncbi:hypothetical protein Patl1_13773 [Pistacia atlantica]|uniref:Uncharacterized protein n=1 Tax=Pistacia atlantica TaxID=434234 RepID=A0ACC1AT75_9ROSI|nr:hypothetical protein Patl1_13773 [Pistacia atlantica]
MFSVHCKEMRSPRNTKQRAKEMRSPTGNKRRCGDLVKEKEW